MMTTFLPAWSRSSGQNLEVVHAGELRLEALLVVVVAGTAPQEPRAQGDRLAVAVGPDGPRVRAAVPRDGGDPVPVADQLVDGLLGGDLLEVALDERAVGQGLR